MAVIAHIVLRYVQNKNDFLWYRQALSWRRLSLSQKRTLENVAFYKALNPNYKRQFEHRVACFIADKTFKHRYKKQVSDAQKVLLASVAVMLTFGRRHYLMPQLETLLLFDGPFKSPANAQLHKGEYNPRAKVLALSWPDVVKGAQISDDNFDLALHEFTHVIHIESERASHIDGMRYHKYHQFILAALLDKQVRSRMENTPYFRMYAFTNQYEFMAVLTEYFFESNALFEQNFPLLYSYISKGLLYKKEWLASSRNS